MSSLSYEQFKVLHSETIMCCQIIEGDLKWIYAFMHKGDPGENRSKVSNYTLGQIVNKLKELDNSDGKPYVSASDYNFLSQMTEKRNYWCHQCYRDFLYEDNWLFSKVYEKVCNKLQKDHDRLDIVYKNVEQLKIKLKR